MDPTLPLSMVAVGETSPEVGAAIGRRDNRGSRRRKWGYHRELAFKSDDSRAPRPTVPGRVTIRFVYPTATMRAGSAMDPPPRGRRRVDPEAGWLDPLPESGAGWERGHGTVVNHIDDHALSAISTLRRASYLVASAVAGQGWSVRHGFARPC